MMDRFSEVWCRAMHRGAMWPIHGKYICPTCFRQYTVNWSEEPRYTAQVPQPEERNLSISSTATAVH